MSSDSVLQTRGPETVKPDYADCWQPDRWHRITSNVVL